MDILDIKNLSFSYGNHKIINYMNLSIKKGSFTTILGKNGSGKSTLTRIISGINIGVGSVYVDGISICDDDYRKNIGVVFANPDNMFVNDLVKEEIVFALENLGYVHSLITERFNKYVKMFNLSEIVDKSISELSKSEKIKVALASVLVYEPSLLILDEALSGLSYDDFDFVKEIICKLNNNGLSVINITHNNEEILMGTDIVIMDKGKIIVNNSLDEVLNSEFLFKTYGVEFPFVVNLSNKLKYYEMIDKIYLDIDSLVEKI